MKDRRENTWREISGQELAPLDLRGWIMIILSVACSLGQMIFPFNPVVRLVVGAFCLLGVFIYPPATVLIFFLVGVVAPCIVLEFDMSNVVWLVYLAAPLMFILRIRSPGSLRLNWGVVGMILFLIASLLVTFAMDENASDLRIYLDRALIILTPLCLAMFIRTPQERLLLVWFIYLACVVLSASIIWYVTVNGLDSLRVSNDVVLPMMFKFMPQGRVLMDVNYLSLHVLLGVPACVCVFMGLGGKSNGRLQLAGGAALLLALLALVFMASRMATGLVGVLIVMTLSQRGIGLKQRLLLALALGFILLYLLANYSESFLVLQQRWEEDEVSTAGNRSGLWMEALAFMFNQAGLRQWLVGGGLTSNVAVLGGMGVHNNYIEWLMDMGMMGLGGLLILLFGLVRAVRLDSSWLRAAKYQMIVILMIGCFFIPPFDSAWSWSYLTLMMFIVGPNDEVTHGVMVRPRRGLS